MVGQPVEVLQKEGWARAFDLEAFKDDALAYADDRIKGKNATEPKLKYYTGAERGGRDDGQGGDGTA